MLRNHTLADSFQVMTMAKKLCYALEFFKTAVAYRLGVPVWGQQIPCPLCRQPINIFGDHTTCCARKGDPFILHTALRNCVDGIGTDALLSPVMEKKGIWEYDWLSF